MNNKIFYDSFVLYDFCANVLFKAGLSQEDAEIIADSIIFAELKNYNSFGLQELLNYIEKIEKGILNSKAHMKYLIDEGSVCLIDADNGIGHIAAYKAITKAVDIAKDYGIGVVLVKDSNSLGEASYYSLKAVKEGMIGVVMTNTSSPKELYASLMGKKSISIAVPAGEEEPIVLDMEILPSLLIDIFCGILPGSALNCHANNISGLFKTGHVFISINISKFISEQVFIENVDLLMKNIESIESLQNGEGKNNYLQGQIRLSLMREREENGIPVSEDVLLSLNKLAEKYNVSKL